jgi:hypothetical protein
MKGLTMFVQILNKDWLGKMVKAAIVLLLLMAMPMVAWAAGSAKAEEHRAGRTRFVTWTWTADASGDVSGTVLGQFTIDIRGGVAYGLLADPEAGVSADYDVTIQAAWTVTTEAGAARTIEFADVTSGNGTDLSNSANGQYLAFAKPFPLESCNLTLTVANAGNATSGTIVLLVWEE